MGSNNPFSFSYKTYNYSPSADVKNLMVLGFEVQTHLFFQYFFHFFVGTESIRGYPQNESC